MLRRRDSMLLAACIGAFVVGAVLLLYWCDDAYIFQRYAANAAAGDGLVYNPGDRVEGFTSPLWMAVHVALQVVGATQLFWSQALGIAASAMLLAISARTPTTWLPAGAPRWCAWVAPVLIASHIGVLAYAGSGLETSLFVLLVALAVVRRAKERAAPELAPLSALWCALAFWARPEAVFVAAVCLALLIADWKEGRRTFVRRWLVLAALPVGLLVALRWTYYGDLLPNTYYAKQLPFLVGLREATSYVVGWSLWHAGWPLFALGAMLPLRRSLPPGFTAIPLGALAILLATLLTGGDWMPFHRFLIPAVVLASLCAQQLAGIAVSRGMERPAAIGFALVVALQLGVILSPEPRETLRSSRADVIRWLDIGRQLSERLQTDDVVVVGAAGSFGVTLKSRVIDFYGLVDRTIAHAPIRTLDRVVPGHVRSDTDYLMSLKPKMFVVALIPRDEPARENLDLVEGFWSRAHDDLLRHPELANYRPLNLRYEDAWVAVLERRPDAPE